MTYLRFSAIKYGLAVLFIFSQVCLAYPPVKQKFRTIEPLYGIVQDKNQRPLTGVAIKDKNGTILTYTDGKGEFFLQELGNHTVLSFSLQGYLTQMVAVRGAKRLTIMMVNTAHNTLEKVTHIPKNQQEQPPINYPSPYPSYTPAAFPRDSVSTAPYIPSSSVEQSPEFVGGADALQQFIAQNLRYPRAATQANVQGKVILNFLVTQYGDIQDIRVVKGLGFGCDEEAVRLVSIMPKWQPGMNNSMLTEAHYTLPVPFESRYTAVSNPCPPTSRLRIGNNPNGNILYFLEGLEIDSNISLSIEPQKILSIEVIKETEALAIYGERGRNGVVLITLKK